jgi:acyl-CoA synthetase (NDP forming)
MPAGWGWGCPFVSVGNKADISGNDLIQYWEGDEGTDLILLYLESFGNPRKFARIARRVARKKPIGAVKGGRSAAGFRATQSHTGPRRCFGLTVDALFHQSGVIRTDSLAETFDAAALLTTQPIPRGDRVAIVTNAGGQVFSQRTPAKTWACKCLSSLLSGGSQRFPLSSGWSENPVDMVASASASDYAHAIRSAATSDPNVDALIVIFIRLWRSARRDC